MIKVIVGDDHSIVREGLSLVFNKTKDIIVADEAENGFELENKISENNYDIAIVDINMPGKYIIDLIKDIKSMNEKIGIIIFTVQPEKLFASRVLMSGASAYLNKICPMDDLIEAVRSVYAGKKYISDSIADMFIKDYNKKVKKSQIDNLTEREFQILMMFVSGMGPSEIASELFLSTNTINNHRKNILRKLKLEKSYELILYAAKNNLLQ